MSYEAVTEAEAAPEAEAVTEAEAAPEAEAVTEAEAAPEAEAEAAPRPRAMARKAERDAINARKRLAAAEAKEAALADKLSRLEQLESFAESLRSASPLERARLAEIDIGEVARLTLESDSPEARQRAIVAEELAAREKRAEEQRSHAMRARQEATEADFAREAERHAVVRALLAADDDDGEPLLSSRELLAQGYRLAARINARLAAEGSHRVASNTEILDAIGAKYTRRFARPESASVPTRTKPVSGSVVASRGATRPAPRTMHEINARMMELMNGND